MRFELETSIIPFRFMGIISIITGVLLIICGFFARITILIGLPFLIAGLILQRSNRYIIRHPPQPVIQQLTKTLDLMDWTYSHDYDRIKIPVTDSAISVTPFPFGSLIYFRFGTKGDASKQKAMSAILVKYQRYIKS